MIDNLEELKNALSNHLAQDRKLHYGNVDPRWIRYAEESHGSWDENRQLFRAQDLQRYGFMPGKSKVLDLAAGCGQFVQYAVNHGWDVWGIEPEKWKLEFTKRKFEHFGLFDAAERIVEGVGESLDFSDDTFDCVTTYQTLEHVQDPLKVICEMVRVTKVGGGIYIRCPDYRSTFEPHYQLPWLPLFPRKFAKYYLRLLGRPGGGLDHIQYVTKPRILKALSSLETSGVRLMVFDDSRIRFENGLRRMRLPNIPFAYSAWRLFEWISVMFRKEISVNLFVRVISK